MITGTYCRFIASLAVFFDLCLLSANAYEVTMSANVLPPAALGSIMPTGSGTQSDPYLYTFTTTNGLDMVTYKIYGDSLQNKHVRLDLNGGAIMAATNGSGQCTSLGFDLKGNSVSSEYASGLSIMNVDRMRVGKIWTWQGTLNGASADHNGGPVVVGTNTLSGRAGKVEISEILTYAGNAHTDASSGNVSIYGKADVLIWDGVNGGDIDTHHPNVSNDGGSAGSVTIWHDGAFRVNEIWTYCFQKGGAPISLKGDISNDSASGNLEAAALKTYSSSGDSGGPGGNVTITGYDNINITNGIYAYQDGQHGFARGGGDVSVLAEGDIHIGTVQTYARSGVQATGFGGDIDITTTGGSVEISNGVDASSIDKSAGNITITCLGALDILGDIDLNGSTGDGILVLKATAGAVTIRDLDCSLFQTGSTNTFYSGTTRSYIMGVLSNFDTTNNPAVQLSAETGQVVFYGPRVAGNEYLGGLQYNLTNGGQLRPLWPAGTLLIVR